MTALLSDVAGPQFPPCLSPAVDRLHAHSNALDSLVSALVMDMAGGAATDWVDTETRAHGNFSTQIYKVSRTVSHGSLNI